jgi:hypothetical protein
LTAFVPGLSEADPKKVILALQQLAAGRSNATGVVTLATGAATTVVSDPNCAVGTVPLLVPQTASAATELGNGTLYISAVTNGSFTITHANSATAGRKFLYALQG